MSLTVRSGGPHAIATATDRPADRQEGDEETAVAPTSHLWSLHSMPVHTQFLEYATHAEPTTTLPQWRRDGEGRPDRDGDTTRPTRQQADDEPLARIYDRDVFEWTPTGGVTAHVHTHAPLAADADEIAVDARRQRETIFGALQHNTVPDAASSLDIFFSLPSLEPPPDDDFTATSLSALLPGPSLLGSLAPTAATTEPTPFQHDERRSLLGRVKRNAVHRIHREDDAHRADEFGSGNLLASAAVPAADAHAPSHFEDTPGSSFLANILGVGLPPARANISHEHDADEWGSESLVAPAWVPPHQHAQRATRQQQIASAEEKERREQQAHIDRVWAMMQQIDDADEEDRPSSPPSTAPSAVSDARVRIQPSSTAFPFYPLPALAQPFSFSQASWDSRATQRATCDRSRDDRGLETRSTRQLFKVVLEHLLLHDDTADAFVIGEAQLVREVMLMLQAISTPHMRWHAEARAFALHPPQLRLADSSPSALARLMAPLLSLGAAIKSLFEFVAIHSVTGVGVVVHALARSVEQVLHQYTAAIIRLERTIRARRERDNETITVGSTSPSATITLMEIALHLRPVIDQVRFLSSLCQVPRSLDDPDSLPRGAPLLTHLYTLCLGHSCSAITAASSSLLLRSIFLRCLAAYMTLVHAWVYRGKVCDPFHEFIVEWRKCRDTTTHATSKPADGAGGDADGNSTPSPLGGRVLLVPHRRRDVSVPIFLRHLEDDLFHAGETVHLLHLYQPRILRPLETQTKQERDTAAAAVRRQQRLDGIDDAARQRQERRRLQQTSYAQSLQQQIAERDAALAAAAATTAANTDSADAELKASIIAAERTRLLAELESVLSPHSIAGGMNKSIDWRAAREQLSPMRAQRIVDIEARYVKELQEKVEQAREESDVTAETEDAVQSEEPKAADEDVQVDSEPVDSLRPTKLDLSPDALGEAGTAREAADAPAPEPTTDAPLDSTADTISTTPPESSADKPVATSSGPPPSASSSSISEEQKAVSVSEVVDATTPRTIDGASGTATHDQEDDDDDEISFKQSGHRVAASAHDAIIPRVDARAEEHADSAPTSPSLPPFQSSRFLQTDTLQADSDSGDTFSSAAADHALHECAAQFESDSSLPLPLLLQSALLPPLMTHMSHLATLGVSHFRLVHDVDRHLRVLRQYMLMQDGAVMGDFCERVWTAARDSLARTGTVRLDAPGLDAMIAAASDAYQSDPTHHQLAVRHLRCAVDPRATLSLGDLTSWRGVSLHYSVPYPLSAILTPESLMQYSRVTQFLMQVHRVQQDLQWMWTNMKQTNTERRQVVGSLPAAVLILQSRLRVLQCARAEMSHFVSVLHGYIRTDVIESTWTRMTTRMGRATSWSEIARLHEECLAHIHQACFRLAPPPSTSDAETTSTASRPGASAPLAPSVLLATRTALGVVADALDQILASIVDFRSRLAAVDLRRPLTRTDWLALVSARDRFRNLVQFLVHVMQHQTSGGETSDLSSTGTGAGSGSPARDLLDRLDYNRYYQERGQRSKWKRQDASASRT